MIWIFDSGFGGLQTLKYFYEFYPQYNYLFLADNANIPYGEKTPDEIKDMTFVALHWLFDHWAKIVVLACNTAAAYSIRAWQLQFSDQKVLSITVPGVEKIILKNYELTGVLTTQATLEVGVYHDLFARFGGKRDAQLICIGANKLVPAIEDGNWSEKKREELVQSYLNRFPSNLDCLVLGCTHFPIWKATFEKLFHVDIVDSGYESALKFWNYLKEHKQIEKTLTQNGAIKFFVTGDPEFFEKVWKSVFENIFWVRKIVL